MLEYLEIIGGKPLSGTVKVSGAKNAVLPMLIAPLLTAEKCIIKNVPALRDVQLLISLLTEMGAQIEYKKEEVHISTPEIVTGEVSFSLVKSLRASFWILGPLLARTGSARVALPGGDLIGSRPVDLHLDALTKMGAEIRTVNGIVYAEAPHGLHGARIELKFPSVGATHQILLAAALVDEVTEIFGAAREPEIVAVANLLSAMGADIKGAGSDHIIIKGRKTLAGAEVEVIGDRIEAATYLCAALATHGQVCVEGIDPETLTPLPELLREMGAEIEFGQQSIKAKAPQELKPIAVKTAPYPGLPTDMQAPLMALLSLAAGYSVIEENIFESRMGHALELNKFGAKIKVDGNLARINGVKHLRPAYAECLDIRCGAALVISCLAAKGVSRLYEVHHLRRGYVNIEQKFKSLGAEILTQIESPEDYLMSGC